MKKLFITTLLALVVGAAHANDGVFYVNGNHLEPMQENDIAVTKEVLTISLCDDGYAHVDVYYEMNNRGAEKTINVGFEASIPYMSGEPFSPQGIHPFIKGFTVTHNGTRLTHRNGVVRDSDDEQHTDFVSLDTRKWHLTEGDDFSFDEGNSKMSNGRETIDRVAYAYFFKATFKPGKNTIHHTYRYKMSFGVCRAFEVPYWLTPCTRWANHQVDDFTLRIKADKTAKHFFLYDKVFRRTPFKVTSGKGKVRAATADGNHYQEVTLRNGVVECHVQNFRPTEDMVIQSADQLATYMGDDIDLAGFFDRAAPAMPMGEVSYREFYGRAAKNEAEQEKLNKRILRNLPYANRGYVFKDKQLQRFFDARWWYMPDPTWQMSTDDFKATDWLYINEYGKE